VTTSIFFLILNLFVAVLFVVVILAAIRWVTQSVNRSIKARQDLARGVADLADRIERLEKRICEMGQTKS
jgi:small-conductance mechanosensitive channel